WSYTADTVPTSRAKPPAGRPQRLGPHCAAPPAVAICSAQTSPEGPVSASMPGSLDRSADTPTFHSAETPHSLAHDKSAGPSAPPKMPGSAPPAPASTNKDAPATPSAEHGSAVARKGMDMKES